MNEIALMERGKKESVLRGVVFGLLERVKKIVVRDKSSLNQAHEALIYIKGIRKQIDDFCDPNIGRLHMAHKEAILQKKAFQRSAVEAEDYIKPQISSYLVKLEQIRKVAEEKARREREEAERKAKEEEEARLEAAIKAEEKGDLEEAEKILDREPIQDPLTQKTIVPFKTKLQGLSTRTDWLWELVNFAEVPDEWKTIILAAAKITDHVKATRGTAKIPGIRIYSKTITIQRGGY